MAEAEEIDDVTLAIIRDYYGRDPRVPELVTDTVFSQYMDATWSAEEFLLLITDAINNIPEQDRADAEVEFYGGDYDESGRLVITYNRLQTPEEVAKDVAKALEYARGVKANERAAYERLKAKYD